MSIGKMRVISNPNRIEPQSPRKITMGFGLSITAVNILNVLLVAARAKRRCSDPGLQSIPKECELLARGCARNERHPGKAMNIVTTPQGSKKRSI